MLGNGNCDVWPTCMDDAYLNSQSQVTEGAKIEISGYPGEKGGFCFTHTGTFEKLVEKPGGGTLVLYKNVDTTPG